MPLELIAGFCSLVASVFFFVIKKVPLGVTCLIAGLFFIHAAGQIW